MKGVRPSTISGRRRRRATVRRARVAGLLGCGLAATAALALAARRAPEDLIRATEPGVVLVLAADVVGGRLAVAASGSGTIVSADGAILTAAHVLREEASGRAHDLFLIGRHREGSAEPELFCAGRPAAARVQERGDLALIACDRDLDGQPFSGPPWPAVPIGRSESLTPGAQIWVLGLGGPGGARFQASAGLLSGWTGERGGAGRRDFMRTDATVSPGSSGGAAVDERGWLIGVPTAYRSRSATRGGQTIALGQIGLVRPIELARGLLEEAQAGFVPGSARKAGVGGVEDGEPGAVLVAGTVVDGASGRAVAGATVLVGTREGAPAEAIAVGRTDGDGRFVTDHAVPRGGPFAVTVVAAGYRPLDDAAALSVPPDAPHLFEPWPPIVIDRTPTWPILR